jgi:CheY-like chemotaxis protein
MDYRMPKLNGITACRYILAKDPAARVILISGWTAPVEPEASGAMAILTKPVAMPILEAALNAASQYTPKKKDSAVDAPTDPSTV